MNTPTPWKTALTPTGKLKIVDRNGFSIANLTSNVKTENEDNADKIVTCVNYHDRLVDKLNTVKVALEKSTELDREYWARQIQQLLTEIEKTK